jgi:hypothetical protein
MSKKLGETENPLVEKFEQGGKLYCVPLLHSVEDAPKEYSEKLDLCWAQVAVRENYNKGPEHLTCVLYGEKSCGRNEFLE